MATDQDLDDILGADEPEEPTAEEPKAEDPPEDPPEEKPEDPPAEKTGEEPAPPADDVAALQGRIEELEKINSGLLKAKTSSQASKQSVQEALEAEREKVRAYEQRLRQASAPKPPEDKKLPDKIEVKFDEEGNAYIPGENLKGLQAPGNDQKVSALEGQLKQYRDEIENMKLNAAQKAELNSFLSEKDGYAEAFSTVQEQWSHMKNELFDQFVTAKGLPVPKTQEEALEIAASPEFRAAFLSKYPGSDPEIIMQAGLSGSKYYQRKALDFVLGKKEKSSHTPLPANKPPSLADSPGVTTNEDDETLKRYADMSLEDFLRLSPEEEVRMERLLARG